MERNNKKITIDMHTYPCNFIPVYFWVLFQGFNNLVLDLKWIWLGKTATIICEILIRDNFEHLTHTISAHKSHSFFSLMQIELMILCILTPTIFLER